MSRVRFVAIGCFLIGSLATACGVGGVDGPGGDHPARIPSDDPAVDARLDALGIICESKLTLSGSFAPGDPAPDGHNGCWPVGTWTVNPTVELQGCDPQADLLANYVYEVTHPEDSNSVVFSNDPTDDRVNLKITTDGSNACLGAFEHFALDFSVLGLRPVLGDDGTLTGIGTFDVYDHDPFAG